MRKLWLAAGIVVCLHNVAHAQILAQVGGVSITLQDVLAADPAAAKDPAVRNKTLLTLINRQAVLNAAERSGIRRSPEYKRALKQAEDNIAIQLLAQQFAASHPISDQELASAYQKIFDKPAPEQYRLREITTESYDAAEAAINEIKGGASFSIVAAEKSQDEQTAALGGETGWIMETQLLAPILKTVQSLKIGEVAGPVAVPKGYVVLQLLGKRPAPKPTLEQAKPQLSETIRQQEWEKYVVSLRTEQGAHLVVPLPEK